MITANKKNLLNVALLVLFLSTASTDKLLNKTESRKPLPNNCVEAVSAAGSKAKSGIYQIHLPLEGAYHRFYVYCLLDRNGGEPWLLVQRRQNDSVDFDRDWHDYKFGFENLATSFFIGLDKLHALTQMQLYELQIELHDFNKTVAYANYESFAIGDVQEKYALNILGSYSGSAGDSLLDHHDGEKFTTYDQDNDAWSGNCAAQLKEGWWYYKCHQSNLNGEFLNGTNADDGRGIIWESWRGENYSLKYAHMGIRPIKLNEQEGN